MGFLLSLLVLLVVVLLGIAIVQSVKLKQLRGDSPAHSGKIDKPTIVSDSHQIGSDALFATLSHELRTPLNGLLGVAQMLNEEQSNEDFEAIEGCARHMLSVLKAVVNHATIQAPSKISRSSIRTKACACAGITII